jgi:UDP-N-acetylmuramate--alanine ligase
MSGLALISKALGAQVTGSDRAASSYTERLREHGIEPVLGHAAGNVPSGAEVVYSSAIPAENPERLAAGRELHRADLLAEIAALRRCLAVTGTHGKTTTAAMAVHALRGAGLDPSYVVGGELRSTGSNAGWGTGDWIVIEADESDRSLLKLSPEIAVLTNAELDHHATYSSRLELEATFSTFMARAGDRAVVWDRPALRALCPPGAVPYDAVDPELGPGGSRFEWREIEVRLSVPGAHNAVNAAGALTACALAGADPARAAAHGAAWPHIVGSGGLRRLRPSPHGGRRGHRRRPYAGARAPDRGLPAPPLLAHARPGGPIRRGPRRRR